MGEKTHKKFHSVVGKSTKFIHRFYTKNHEICQSLARKNRKKFIFWLEPHSPCEKFVFRKGEELHFNKILNKFRLNFKLTETLCTYYYNFSTCNVHKKIETCYSRRQLWFHKIPVAARYQTITFCCWTFIYEFDDVLNPFCSFFINIISRAT